MDSVLCNRLYRPSVRPEYRYSIFIKIKVKARKFARY